MAVVTRLFEAPVARFTAEDLRVIEALLFAAAEPLAEILGRRFISSLVAVKQAEWDAYQRVISSWERENLLLNV